MTNASPSTALPRPITFPIPKAVRGFVERALGIRELESVYAAIRSRDDAKPITERLLDHLHVTHRASEKDLENIPRKGAGVLVANHPFGLLEGAVLASLLASVRSDVKFLANGILAAIPEVRDMLIAVDPMGGVRARQANQSGIRQALEHLVSGGLLVVFPAGEVSHFQWKDREVSDPKWQAGTSRLLAMAHRRIAGLPVIPAHIAGANSFHFQFFGMLHPRIRTALLVHELLNKRNAHVSVRIGSPISTEKILAIPTDVERVEYLRWRTYLLASQNEYRALSSAPLAHRLRRAPVTEEVAPAVDPAWLAGDIAALAPSALLSRSGELSAYIASSREIPNILTEIGRLREITFRAVGEGTGKRADLDEFDADYLHLFLWHEVRQEVVGAYRLAGTEIVRSARGVHSLYTATLFEYGPEFLQRMGPALELGRSFIRTEYQKGFAPLLLLWKGIGKYIARNPRYRTLFGAVSISNQYQSVSRELMVSFLERHASLREWMNLVSMRNPFRSLARCNEHKFPTGAFDIEDLSAVVSDLEPSRSGVPVLLRQYLKLGGKLLGFNVDPKFSNALDGLIVVDLARTEPKLLERYLGKAETAAFLKHQLPASRCA